MKCFGKQTKNLKIMLCVGLVLLLAGIVSARIMGEDATPLAMRMAGFASGLGGSLAAFSGAWLIWKKAVGARRAQDKELEMADERGQAINTKAQAVIGVVATIIIIAIDIIALVRDDDLYMILATAGCMLIGLTGMIARKVLAKRL